MQVTHLQIELHAPAAGLALLAMQSFPASLPANAVFQQSTDKVAGSNGPMYVLPPRHLTPDMSKAYDIYKLPRCYMLMVLQACCTVMTMLS